MVRERCQNLFEEEKEKKRRYHRERKRNVSGEQKQKLVEYRRNYYIIHNKELLDNFADFFKDHELIKLFISGISP